VTNNEALTRFRGAISDAAGRLERAEARAYTNYAARNRRALEGTGKTDPQAFVTYTDVCNAALETYWHDVRSASDECAQFIMQEQETTK